MTDLVSERYKYILGRLAAVDEGAHRALLLYQSITTALVAAGLALFVGYGEWGLPAATARAGIEAILYLVAITTGFSVMLIVAGIAAWFDYRREECELLDEYVRPGFRKRPRLRNCYRWPEAYMMLFMVVATGLLWLLGYVVILPAVL